MVICGFAMSIAFIVKKTRCLRVIRWVIQCAILQQKSFCCFTVHATIVFGKSGFEFFTSF